MNKTKTAVLPPEILNALEKTTRDYPIKTIVAEGQKLARYLKNRHPAGGTGRVAVEDPEVQG